MEDQPLFIKGLGSHMGFRQGRDPSAFQMMDHLEIMVGLETLLNPTELGCVPGQGQWRK